jgi:hypothetical protein
MEGLGAAAGKPEVLDMMQTLPPMLQCSLDLLGIENLLRRQTPFKELDHNCSLFSRAQVLEI